jgi:hypothetical protein
MSTARRKGSRQICEKAMIGGLSALTVALLTPAAALGSGGQITRALANPEWTVGDIAATVSWSGCAEATESSDCAWIPYATIGPGASESDCDSPERDLPGLGEGIRLAFGAGGFRGPGPFSHESPMVSLRGTPEELLCLFAIERTRTGSSRTSHSLSLDAALLTVPPPATDIEAPVAEEEPAPIEEPPTEEPPESSPPEAEPPAEGEPPTSPEAPMEPLAEGPGFVVEPPEAPRGEIVRALANADWTRSSIAGSVTWDGCIRTVGPPTSFCAWIPYTTVGPGTSQSVCASAERDWSSLGEDVSLVSWGGEGIGAGVYEFDLPGIWLDHSADLLCLAVIEVTAAAAYTHRLAAALLTGPRMDLSDAKVAAEN